MAFEPRRYDSRCPVKSFIRRTYASGSTKRLVEKLISLGWYPGARISLGRRKRHSKRGED